MDKAHILEEIKRTAESNGGVPLGIKSFEAATGITEWDWQKVGRVGGMQFARLV